MIDDFWESNLTHRFMLVLFGLIFLLVLVLNSYLLVSAADGRRLVQHVESRVGRQLTCIELYQARAINTYFEFQHPQQGEALYLLSLTWPIWFSLSIGAALELTGVLHRRKLWRWLPVISMSMLVLFLILQIPTIAQIGCAID